MNPWGYVLIWYIVGFLTIAYTRHIKDYFKKQKTQVNIADILILLLSGIAGFFIPLVVFIVWVEENKILTKPLATFRKPRHKSD